MLHWGTSRTGYPMLFALAFALVFSVWPATAGAAVLRTGTSGNQVFELQLGLFQLGFLAVKPTGLFDSKTYEAVRLFQAKEGLAVDGVVGDQTWQRLLKAQAAAPKKVHVVKRGDTLWSLARTYGITVEMLAKANRLREADRLQIGQRLVVPVPVKDVTPAQAATEKTPVTAPAADTPAPSGAPPAITAAQAEQAREAKARLTPALMQWNEVDRIFAKGTVARIVDVKTGKQFRVRRLYGHYHADVEPLTAEDTAVMKEIYGGRWSWDRRAVVVEVAGKRIAGSINGMPHGGDSISTNNFAGHFCVHFLGSRIHRTGRTDPQHQAAVQEAANLGAGSVAVVQPQS